jgi:hypothetical protein
MALQNKRSHRNVPGQAFYPHVLVQLTGTDGNALSIVGKVRRAMEHSGIHDDECEAFVHEALSGDYDHVLATAMRWVNVS